MATVDFKQDKDSSDGVAINNIVIPNGLKDILSHLSKEVIYSNPKNVEQFCAEALESRLRDRNRRLEMDYQQVKVRSRRLVGDAFVRRRANSTLISTDSDSGLETSQYSDRRPFVRKVSIGTETDWEHLGDTATSPETERGASAGPDSPARCHDQAMQQLTRAVKELDRQSESGRTRGEEQAQQHQEATVCTPKAEQGPGEQQQQQPSMFVPTSDFEEECGEDDDALSDQLLEVSLEVDGHLMSPLRLLVAKSGVRKLTGDDILVTDLHTAALAKTVVPIVVASASGLREDPAANSFSSITSDLAGSPSSSLGSPHSPARFKAADPCTVPVWSSSMPRPLSPARYEVTPRRTKLIRQGTFVESSSQTAKQEKSDKQVEVDDASLGDQGGGEAGGSVSCRQAAGQTVKSLSELATQTVTVAYCQVMTQTDFLQKLLADEAVTKCEVSDSSTQTAGDSEVAERENSKGSVVADSDSAVMCSLLQGGVTNSEKADGSQTTEGDEVVLRVLLEHTDDDCHCSSEADRAKETSKSADLEIESDRCPSFMSLDSDRAASASIDIKTGKSGTNKPNLDLSRTVNYLDLSKLGNEGETPNSDEIWITVEDDNKFLTSDTETYSVATDKVSTMATYKGHIVADGCDQNAVLNSASETELAELGRESLASDLDAQDFAGGQFKSMLCNEIRPMRTSLDSTSRTVTGIADTLYQIQDDIHILCSNVTHMKSKIIPDFVEEERLFSEETSNKNAENRNNSSQNDLTQNMVEKLMTKLEAALKGRDETFQKVVDSLEEDNVRLRKEVESLKCKTPILNGGQQRESGNMQQTVAQPGEEKLNSFVSPKLETKSADTDKRSNHSRLRRHKKRSRSRHQESQDSLNHQPLTHGQRSKMQRDSLSSSTSSINSERSARTGQSSAEKHRSLEKEFPTGELASYKRKFFILKERERELLKRNQELEAEILKNGQEQQEDKSPQKDELSEASPSKDRKQPVSYESKEVQTAGEPEELNEKETNTSPDLWRQFVSQKLEQNGEPSSEDSKATTFNGPTDTREDSGGVGGVAFEVADSITVLGRGSGCDGGTPSPGTSPRRNGNVFKSPLEETSKQRSEPAGGSVSSSSKPQPPAKPANRKDESKVTKLVGKLEASKKAENGNNNPAVKTDKSRKKVHYDQQNNQDKKGNKGATEGTKLANDKQPSSKIIEGDDFRVTITSNQELVSCELSGTERNQDSPKKKIVVTPKTPDKQAATGKKPAEKQEVAKKKGGPVKSTHVKTNGSYELPAPAQYPAARPPRDQLPAPTLKPAASCSPNPAPSYPVAMNFVGYNTNTPATPTKDYTAAASVSPGDRSLASSNLPVSGRNTRMSFDSDVITMVIKQDSRDSNVYDAPSSIPDVRESPDGAYSYVIDGPAKSSMSNISDIKYDIKDDVESDGFERDTIMEFVLLEESLARADFNMQATSPFGTYAQKVKQKVIREFVSHRKGPIKRATAVSEPVGEHRPPTRALSVRKKVKKSLLRAKSQSVDQINKIDQNEKSNGRLSRSKGTFYSTERLPTLTPSEEERIVRIKKYEDETEMWNEKRRHQKFARETRKRLKRQLSLQNGDIKIFESGKPVLAKIADGQEEQEGEQHQEDSVGHHTDPQGDAVLKANPTKQGKYNNRSSSLDRKQRRLSDFCQLMLSAECFIVSRGWQIDQSLLQKAISKLEGVNFVRVQIAGTINRVIENIRPHNDVVIIHIGTQELSEAACSISSLESVPGVAGSIATVFSKHIISASKQFRETKFVVSMPIPRNTRCQDMTGRLEFHDALRASFMSCLKANVVDYENVIICTNDNLANDSGQPDSKFYTDSVNLNSAGMRRLAKNWEAVILKMTKTVDGRIYYRRSSDSSSMTSSSSVVSSTTSSAVKKEPWKPY